MKKIFYNAFALILTMLIVSNSCLKAGEPFFTNNNNFKTKDFPELEKALYNKQLYYSEGYSSGTSGWRDAAEINIYGNNTFSFWTYSFENNVTSYEKEDKGKGYWSIITGYSGEPIIEAQLEDGRVWYLTIRASGNSIYLNDKKYSVKNLY